MNPNYDWLAIIRYGWRLVSILGLVSCVSSSRSWIWWWHYLWVFLSPCQHWMPQWSDLAIGRGSHLVHWAHEQNRQFVWHRATLSPVSELLWHRPPPCWLTVNLSPDSGLWWSVMAPDSRQSQRDAIWMSQFELESPWSLWPGHSTPHTWITRESGRGKHHKCRASGLKGGTKNEVSLEIDIVTMRQVIKR